MNQQQVIVAGGGPVGLATALGLARSGVPVTVLEREPEITTSPRALIYFYVVLDHFERLGIFEDVERAAIRFDEVHFVDFATQHHTVVPASGLAGTVAHPYQLSLGQHKLTAILLEHLSRYPEAQVLFGTEITDITENGDHVQVEVSGPGGTEGLTGAWLVGADGASSFVRQRLGIEFRGKTWPDLLMATDLRYDFEKYGYGGANFLMDDRYGAIIVKIEDNLWRCAYQDDPDADTSEAAVLARMRAWMDVALPGEDKSFELVQYSPYRIHQRCAETLRRGRVVLAGDAAHITNPCGGLGLTAGLLDSVVLAEALAAVLQKGENDAVLDLYSQERRRAFLDHVSPAATMNKLMVFELSDPVLKKQAFDRLSAAAADPQLAAMGLLAMKSIETPSVLGRPAPSRQPSAPTERGSFWVGTTPVDTDAGVMARGQMFVEWESPVEPTGVPVVLVHGGGGQGTDFLTTPDGRLGWAPLLARQGYPAYVVDRPGHGRSTYRSDVLGPMAPPLAEDFLRNLIVNPTEGPFSHPTAFLHNKWPGSDTLDDAVWRQFAASGSPMMASSVEAEQLAADRLVELLERIGPAVLLGHSLGVPSVYRAADMRPDLVRGLVAVEGVGPQFLNLPALGVELRWGVTSTPLAYDPPAAQPQDLDLTVEASGPVQLTLQREPARRLANLSRVPIALVSAEGSAFRWFGDHVRRFLEQAGCTVDNVRLWEHGVRGNGHAMMLESNNEDSIAVVADWIARRIRPAARGR